MRPPQPRGPHTPCWFLLLFSQLPRLPSPSKCNASIPFRCGKCFVANLRGHPARKCRPRDGEKMREGHGLYIPFCCLPRRREGAPHHGIWTLSTPPRCGSMFDDRLARPTSCHATRAEGAWCEWATVREGKGNMTDVLRLDNSLLAVAAVGGDGDSSNPYPSRHAPPSDCST